MSDGLASPKPESTAKLLRRAVEEARAAVAASLPPNVNSNRKALIGMCAVVSCETARRLELLGRRTLIEYRLGVAPHPIQGWLSPVHHFWTSCDGYVIDGTAKQLGGPLVLLSRKREQPFFGYEASRSWRTAEAVGRFLRKLGWSGPAAALLVQERAA